MDFENTRRVLAAFESHGELAELSAEDLLGEFPAVQYVPPEGSFHLDLVTRLGTAYRFEELESLRLDFDGVEVCVASPTTLYRMKKDTVRLQDRADAARLRERFELGTEDD